MELENGYQTIMPYLILNNASGFIEFTKNVFNAALRENMYTMSEDGSRIRHAEVAVGGSIIMFTDASAEWKEQTANLFVFVDNADETYQKALNHGAVSLMGLTDQHYGRTCGVTDPFGNVWWITSTLKP